jgi:SAM-dependent methyltransferase
MNSRKSSKDYWDDNWRRAGAGLKSDGEKNFFKKRLDRALKSVFSVLDSHSLNLIEIGAGASEWLPWLHGDYSFNVSGIDYSEEGCERARKILGDAGISGRIWLGDMFSPPDELLKRFDVACSFGLVEHFSDTAGAISACSRFVVPGGIVVTLIPNMTGLNGLLYKTLNRRVFDTHLPLSLDELKQAHIHAGLKPYFSCHLLSLPAVIDLNRHEPNALRSRIRKLAHHISRLVWWLEDKGIGIPENRLTSPYMLCAAKVP